MTKVRVHNLAMSLDGFAAGPHQSLDAPLGVGGEGLHGWAIGTRTGRSVILGEEGGETGVDDDFMAAGFEGIGATIMGRNMFGPIRGEWTGDWQGWWGDEPPYHHPVFVLTHHERESLALGETTFHFVTGGVAEAHARATEAASGKDIRLGGGPSTIQQFLRAGLVDEMHVAVVPIVLGAGERLFVEPLEGFEATVSAGRVAHVVFTRSA